MFIHNFLLCALVILLALVGAALATVGAFSLAYLLFAFFGSDCPKQDIPKATALFFAIVLICAGTLTAFPS